MAIKIDKISNYLKKNKSDFLFITASENNALLLNIEDVTQNIHQYLTVIF